MEAGQRKTVYVVIGANRGIGLGLVTALLARPYTVVVATVRNEAAAVTLRDNMNNTARAEGSSILTVILDLAAKNSPSDIKESFSTAAPEVDYVDVLICAAAYSSPMASCLQTTAQDLRDTFEVNTVAPLMAFQALWPLMERRPPAEPLAPPKFIFLSSSVASMGMMEPMPGGAYGPSKAAANWIVKALHTQLASQGLVSVALHPGFVKTEMGERAARDWNLPAQYPPDTIEDSVAGILKITDTATRDNVSGRFVTQKGEFLDW